MKHRADTIIGVVWAVGMALGIILLLPLSWWRVPASLLHWGLSGTPTCRFGVELNRRNQMGRMPEMIKRICWVAMLIYLVAACATTQSMQGDARNQDKPRGSFLLRFYRGPLNHLSAVRWGQCPMYPSDSAYGMQAIRKHGPLVGWAMAFDRLLRCGRDETGLAPRVIVDGKWKTYDPVENNDFWWHEEKQDAVP